MAGRKTGLGLAHARSWSGEGGALPRCSAPPTGQIFDIPGLSRGGWCPKSAFPPPPGPTWLSASRGGVSGLAVGWRSNLGQRSADTRLHSKRRRGSPAAAGRPVCFPSASQPPCPGRLSLFIRQVGTRAVQCVSEGNASEAPPLRRALSLSVVRKSERSAQLL